VNAHILQALIQIG